MRQTSAGAPENMNTTTQARWTPDQERAILESGATLLVSAAAGSGKTSVLVARIIERLTRPAQAFDMDEFLVVTFTEAAATEMRRRIADAIGTALRARPDDPHLQKQLALLPRAAISTLHAFCKRVLRRYFNRSDLDPGFKVVSEHEAILLQDDVLDEVLEKHYSGAGAADPGGFLDLVDRYGGERGDRDLRRLVLMLYRHSRSLPFPERWLAEVADAFADPGDLGRWWQPARLAALDKARTAERLLGRALRRSRQPGGPAWLVDTLDREAGQAQMVRQALQAGGDNVPLLPAGRLAVRQAIGAVAFADLRSQVGSGAAKQGDDPVVRETVLDWRKQARDALQGLCDTPLGSSLAEERAREDLLALAPSMGMLRNLVREFAAGFREAKRRRNAVDFNDLEHLALDLLRDPDAARQGRLVPSEVALDLRDRFREILVDEYQDTNPVQEAILALIARPDSDRPDGDRPDELGNLFLVGDVKQSIYRFRMADPSLFLRRLDAYPGTGPGPHRIDLQANFRSRQGVVDAVNFLFRQIMTPEVGDLTYDSRAELVCRASYPGEDPPVELHIVGAGGGADSPDGSGRLEREAAAVAARLRLLFDQGATVHDRKGGDRPLRYADVVVLLRAANSDGPVFADALARAGIPVHAQAATGYFGAVEVLTMLSLLDVIDNPRQDIPLAAVLRSPIVGLDTTDLARIRLANPAGEFYDALASAAKEDARLQHFLTRLETWRTAARRGPLSNLVWRLLSETGFLAFASGLRAGAQRRANLLALHDRAREFDHFTRQGLFRFLRFIRRLQDAGEDLGMASAAGENADVVRIMSTHRSKGLEFPVVVVAGLGKRWNLGDLQGDLLLDRDLGLGPRVVDPARRIKYPSFAHKVVGERLRRQMLAEEMRVLYVAMTRAKERLLLFGSADDALKWSEAADHAGGTLPPDLLVAASNPLDWIGAAVARHGAGAALRQEGQQPGDPAQAGDPSCWQVVFSVPERAAPGVPAIASGSRRDAGAPGPSEDLERPDGAPGPSEDLERLDGAPGPIQDLVPVREAALRLAPLQPAPPLTPTAQAVADRLAWRYDHAAITRCPAKVAASQAPAESAPADPDLAPHPAAIRSALLNRPRFVQEDARKLTAAERGTATHLLMQHLDFAADCEAVALEQRLADLVAREIVTPEGAAAIDRAGVISFLLSPLGRRLAQAQSSAQDPPRSSDRPGLQQAGPRAVLREVPFSIKAAAADIQPGLSPEQAAGEWVLVQGMIDCLLDEPEGLTILDYKTDDPGNRTLEHLVAAHQAQMQRYKTAAAAIFSRPVIAAYLVFLGAGLTVEV